jgi:hypothetical protein
LDGEDWQILLARAGSLSPLWLVVLREILERARIDSNGFSDCHKQRAEAGQAATSDVLWSHLLKSGEFVWRRCSQESIIS